jgi:hypothetical protein
MGTSAHLIINMLTHIKGMMPQNVQSTVSHADVIKNKKTGLCSA